MFIKANNGVIEKFPYSIGDLRKENSNISFPRILGSNILATFNVFPVTEQDKPETDRFSYSVKRQLPELVDGQWTVLWDTIAKSTDELAEQDERQAENIRDSRNGKLSASDWTQIADVPLTTEQRAEWATYRQLLRDLTAQQGFPWEITWPAKP
jgi:hypothetical protein